MTHLFMRHRVTDYAVWRTVFDQDAPRRRQAGVADIGVFRSADEPNNVLVVQRIDADVATVTQMMQAMMADPALAESFAAAGVCEPPDVWMA